MATSRILEPPRSLDPQARVQEQLAAARRDASALRSQATSQAAAKGVRYTSFNVSTGTPGGTAMPFESSPSGAAQEQQYEGTPGMLNVGSGVITLPEDGLYMASAFFSFGSNLLTGSLVDIAILGSIFGDNVRLAEMRGPTTLTMMSVSGQFMAAAGDSIALHIGHNVGSTQATGAGSAALPWYLSVVKLRNRL